MPCLATLPQCFSAAREPCFNCSFQRFKTAMFDDSTSDSILLRRNRERAHSDARQEDTLDLDPFHPLLKTPNSADSCAKRDLGPPSVAKQELFL